MCSLPGFNRRTQLLLSTVQYSTVHSHCYDCATWIHSSESTLCVYLEAVALVDVIMKSSITPSSRILCNVMHHKSACQENK